ARYIARKALEGEMTDKERLEEIETKYSTLTVSSEKNGTEYTEVDVEDLVFLIQNGFKQAERVQELESNSYNAHLERLLDRKEQEIERYRKAIKECLERMDEGGARTRSFVYETLKKALEGTK